MKNAEDWLDKYYPVSAYDVASDDVIAMIDHGILKWSGLAPDVLIDYGLEIIFRDDGQMLCVANRCVYIIEIDATTCALCINLNSCSRGCEYCPIFIETGEDCDLNDGNPWGDFVNHELTTPMLELLIDVKSKALDRLEKEKEMDEV